ncbi:MAG: Isopentenyldiphosphate isomerase [Parcubacteria group bacterium GW2011_GWC1_36_108]|nr:MAG: Isopentenyldiphosphate isomerase [Parcubacteria group bacterium GW2011_GWC1_36_108]HAR99668.1 hypothetical protein [Candidatus Moranbacteria bacterium]HBI51138.1 hypothetical protein [Candidatus Moranbacteria bacterium]HBU10423.1 hypothetical protein [Candidatus Moranbacteria bacterium]HCO99298.1 hypothetical protein [Candidatus Moranbacteria bacterium]
MPEEYLDIVDENGNLTGEKELRSVCHEKGLWHNVAVAYFYRIKNNKLELLVHLRSKFKEQNPNKWSMRFGGHVEAGSTIEETVIKEIWEEAGVKILLEEIITGAKSFYDGENNKEIGNSYYYNFKGDLRDLTFNDGEVQEVKWMNIDDIEKSMRNDSNIWDSQSINRFLIRKNDILSKIK